MYVVTRGVLAAGMSVYAAIHAYQAYAGQAEAVWLPFAFALTAVVAMLLSGMLFATQEAWPEHASVALAASSAGALILSLTTGFFGITVTSLQPTALVVLVAEAMVLAAWASERLAVAHDVGSPRDAERDNRVVA